MFSVDFVKVMKILLQFTSKMSIFVPIMWVNTLHIETIDVFTYWKFTYRLQLECIFLFSNLSNMLFRSCNKSIMTMSRILLLDHAIYLDIVAIAIYLAEALKILNMIYRNVYFLLMEYT